MLRNSIHDCEIASARHVDKVSSICHSWVLVKLERRAMMPLSAHIAELAEKHRNLERRIEEEVARLGSDDLEIRRLKQEKLKLKEQISRLSGEEVHH
jgi:hypothetical protein